MRDESALTHPPGTSSSADATTTLSGFIFAATGERYRHFARIAARSLRAQSPGVEIDLYTDVAMPDSDFNRVEILERSWHRSKIDAMIASRFDRTVYLDADTFVLADITDLFDLLDRFDVAVAQDQEPNSRIGTATWRRAFPACFPQFNSGVFAYVNSAPVLALLKRWRDVVIEEELPRDQPVLRELLWDSNLRIATLPPEYNFAQFDKLAMFRGDQIAPRVLHNYHLQDILTRSSPSADVDALLGQSRADILRAMIASDRYLSHEAGMARPPLSRLKKRMLQLRALLTWQHL